MKAVEEALQAAAQDIYNAQQAAGAAGAAGAGVAASEPKNDEKEIDDVEFEEVK